jgi:hypothetical protein
MKKKKKKKGSLPLLQQLATSLYPEQNESSPPLPTKTLCAFFFPSIHASCVQIFFGFII